MSTLTTAGKLGLHVLDPAPSVTLGGGAINDNFQLLANAINYLGSYDSGTVYSVNDSVSDGVSYYIYINATSSSGQTPSTSPAYWSPIAAGFVPYAGATEDVNLGVYGISAISWAINGDGSASFAGGNATIDNCGDANFVGMVSLATGIINAGALTIANYPASGFIIGSGGTATIPLSIWPLNVPMLVNAYSTSTDAQSFTILPTDGSTNSVILEGGATLTATFSASGPAVNFTCSTGITFYVQIWYGAAENTLTVGGSVTAIGGFYGDGSNLVNLPAASVIGTTTNDNANAGCIGEYKTATLANASAISLTSGTAANVISISLTAGDWDVTGVADFQSAGTTNVTQLASGITTVSGTYGPQDSYVLTSLNLTGGYQVLSLPTIRISVASTTTVYMLSRATFTVSTMGAFGTLRARRVR